MPTSEMARLFLQNKSKAMSKLNSFGWPARKSELWKYSSAKSIEEFSWEPRKRDQQKFELPKEVRSLSSNADYTLYIYNGQFISDISFMSKERELCVIPTTQAIEKNLLDWDSKSLDISSYIKDIAKFHFLNWASFDTGVTVSVSGRAVKLCVVNVFGNFDKMETQYPLQVCPKNYVNLRGGANVELMNVNISLNDNPLFVNCSTDIRVGDSSKLEIGEVAWLGGEARFFHRLDSEVNSNSTFRHSVFTWGTGWSRNQLDYKLKGEQSELNVSNFSEVSGEDSHDNYSRIFHKTGNTKSRQLMKSICFDSGVSNFSGFLRIERDAQNSDAAQKAKSLLQSVNARSNNIPQLEVLADDVKAAHGASVGALSEEELFYLLSRGLNKNLAMNMLFSAFSNEVFNSIEGDFLQKNIVSLWKRYECNRVRS